VTQPSSPRRQAREVLLVEDSASDVRMVRELLRRGAVPCNLVVIGDGREALAYLRGEGEHAGRTRPDIVLLDIKLPGLDGHAVLAEVKQDPRLRRTPVLIMSGSDEPSDIARAYERYANCYVTKPVGHAQFARAVQAIEEFWFGLARLPAETP